MSCRSSCSSGSTCRRTVQQRDHSRALALALRLQPDGRRDRRLPLGDLERRERLPAAEPAPFAPHYRAPAYQRNLVFPQNRTHLCGRDLRVCFRLPGTAEARFLSTRSPFRRPSEGFGWSILAFNFSIPRCGADNPGLRLLDPGLRALHTGLGEGDPGLRVLDPRLGAGNPGLGEGDPWPSGARSPPPGAPFQASIIRHRRARQARLAGLIARNFAPIARRSDGWTAIRANSALPKCDRPASKA